jgi:hypothetical protein
MSHVVAIDIQIKDLKAVKKMCDRLGWIFKENQTSYTYAGYWADDSPVPRHLFETEEEYQAVLAMTRQQRKEFMPTLLGKCTHAIKVPGCTYEIGLLQRGDQYIPIWDWWEGKLGHAVGVRGETIKHAYAIEKTKLEAQKKGYYVTEQLLPSGAVKLQIHA